MDAILPPSGLLLSGHGAGVQQWGVPEGVSFLEDAMFDFGEAKRLEFPFKRRGIDYSFVKENDGATIVMGELFGSKWYEVFEKRVNRAFVISGNEIPAKEAFPGDEDFGKWARCVKTLEEAELWAERLSDKVFLRLAEKEANANRDN